LLTVIAVIAVLAAILLPVFHRAKEKAGKPLASVNSNNWRQQPWCMPKTTMRLCLTFGTITTAKASSAAGFSTQPSVNACWETLTHPEAASTHISGTHQFTHARRTGVVKGTVTHTMVLCRQTRLQESFLVFTIMFTEEETGHGSTDDGHHLPEGNYPTTRHHGHSNFAFCDGHVKALLPDNVPSQSFRYWP